MKNKIFLGCNPFGFTEFTKQKLEEASNDLKEATEKAIESINNWNKVNVNIQSDEPKSKYINKPKRNFKR